jgi:hypothetical protein
MLVICPYKVSRQVCVYETSVFILQPVSFYGSNIGGVGATLIN